MMTLKAMFTGAVALGAMMSVAQAADMSRPVMKAPVAEPSQQATGYVEVYGGWANTAFEFCDERCGSSDDQNGFVLGGAGRANYWIGHGMSVQVDAQAEGTSYDVGSNRVSSHSYLVGGHLSWRNPHQSLYGVFGGVGDTSGLLLSSRHAVVGAEAQWYWGQFTAYGQVGYDTTISAIDGFNSADAWFARATGRYFVNPNFMIEATGMFASGDADVPFGGITSGFDTWLWQAKAEWRMATAPISLFAKYQGSQTTYDLNKYSELTVDDHRIMFGLKLNMGDRTLQSTDRSGATLDVISPIANQSKGLGALIGAAD